MLSALSRRRSGGTTPWNRPPGDWPRWSPAGLDTGISLLLAGTGIVLGHKLPYRYPRGRRGEYVLAGSMAAFSPAGLPAGAVSFLLARRWLKANELSFVVAAGILWVLIPLYNVQKAMMHGVQKLTGMMAGREGEARPR